MNPKDKFQYYTVEPIDSISNQEKNDALGAYLMMFVFLVVGIPFPFINLIAALVYCLVMCKKSRFVRFHAWQSFLSQIPITLLNSVLIITLVVRFIAIFKHNMAIDWNMDISYGGVGNGTQDGRGVFSKNIIALIIFIILINIIYMIYSLIAAVKASQGKMHYFWFFGIWAFQLVYKKDTINNSDSVNDSEYKSNENKTPWE